jgi:hypothetical protein
MGAKRDEQFASKRWRTFAFLPAFREEGEGGN